MWDYLSRSEMLLGSDSLAILENARVCVLGIGGVGSYCAEALVRSGIGNLTFVDNDIVEISNINRQLVALHSTIGRKKVDVMEERARDINPKVNISPLEMFYLKPEDIELSEFDYVADAIDTVTGKLAIAKACHESCTPLISSMGCGNRLDPAKIRIGDIYETSGCPLCKAMRKGLRNINISELKVVYSTELPIKPKAIAVAARTPGSIAFVPSVAGLMMASEIVRALINKQL